MSAACLLPVVGLSLTACTQADAIAPPLPQTAIADPRYQGLVFLVASVRHAGTGFTVTNDSTQPWFDVTIALAEPGADEYLARRVVPHSLIVALKSVKADRPASMPSAVACVLADDLLPLGRAHVLASTVIKEARRASLAVDTMIAGAWRRSRDTR